MDHDGHTEKAFLEAIFAQPRDSGLRRVFSNWLKEQGEHDHHYQDYQRYSEKADGEKVKVIITPGYRTPDCTIIKRE